LVILDKAVGGFSIEYQRNGEKKMKALIKVCVLLLVAVFLLNVPSFSDSRRFSTPQPEVELQEEEPGVTPKGETKFLEVGELDAFAKVSGIIYYVDAPASGSIITGSPVSAKVGIIQLVEVNNALMPKAGTDKTISAPTGSFEFYCQKGKAYRLWGIIPPHKSPSFILDVVAPRTAMSVIIYKDGQVDVWYSLSPTDNLIQTGALTEEQDKSSKVTSTTRQEHY